MHGGEPPLDLVQPPHGLGPLRLPVLARARGPAVGVLVEVEVGPPVRRVEAPVARPVLAPGHVQVQDELLRVQQPL